MHAFNAEALWDEGIASFLNGVYEKKQAPLTCADLQYLANEQGVRVGDLLETLFLMAIYGAWYYSDENGVAQELNEDALDDLYAKGRVHADDLKDFDGLWIPCP